MTHYSIIDIAGQSNAAGSSALIDPSGILDLADQGTQTAADLNALFCHDKMNAADLAYGWGDIRGHQVFYDGAYEDGSANPYMGGGPEVGLNRYLYNLGYRNMAYINYWLNWGALEDGKSPWYKGKTGWNAWLAKRAERLAELTAAGHTYQVMALVWHQGIDDALEGRTQAAYEEDTRQIFADWRTDCADYADSPVVLARSVNSVIAGSGAMAPIRAGQTAIGPDFDGIIDVDDLTPYVDWHHLSYESSLTAGERFGALVYTALGTQIIDGDFHGYAVPARIGDGKVIVLYDKNGRPYAYEDDPPVSRSVPTNMASYVSGG